MPDETIPIFFRSLASVLACTAAGYNLSQTCDFARFATSGFNACLFSVLAMMQSTINNLVWMQPNVLLDNNQQCNGVVVVGV